MKYLVVEMIQVVHGVQKLDKITDLLAAYPKHYATVPTAKDGLTKRRIFSEASDFTRKIIFTDPYDFKTVIITGTNGKGSTGSIISMLLNKAGLKTGVISSPAMNDDCTDMIKINGQPISADELYAQLRLAENSLLPIKTNPALTHYMPICVAAYNYFRDQQVDIVVAETAIGGLYDPTVPFNPDVCVFTNITREHEDVLGDTFAKVARHKSRIIGKGSSVILGEEITEEIATTISSYAFRQNASITKVDAALATSTGIICDRENVKIFNGDLLCPNYQHPNLRLAAETFLGLKLPQKNAIHIDLDNPPAGIFPENRFEFRKRNGVTYLFDSAHNEDSYLKLAKSLEGRFDPQKLHFFKGASTDESLEEFRKILNPHKVTYVSGYHPRVFAREGFIDLVDIDFENCERDIGDGVIVICGIFLAPKVKAALFPEDFKGKPSLKSIEQQVGPIPNP